MRYWYCLYNDFEGYNNWHYSSTLNGARAGLRKLMSNRPFVDAGFVMKEREGGKTIIGSISKAPGKMMTVKTQMATLKVRGDRYIYSVWEKGKRLDTDYIIKRDGSTEPYKR